MKFWIGVASLEHVLVGEKDGFCQLCHGKSTPLTKLKQDDFIIYYSPKRIMSKKEPYQMFSAIGQIKNDTLYQVQMSNDFHPFRKDVAFLKCTHVPIKPLIDKLTFIKNKTRWGYPFRYGYFEIVKEDFLLIANSMLESNIFHKIEEKI